MEETVYKSSKVTSKKDFRKRQVRLKKWLVKMTSFTLMTKKRKQTFLILKKIRLTELSYHRMEAGNKIFGTFNREFNHLVASSLLIHATKSATDKIISKIMHNSIKILTTLSKLN